MFIKKIVPFVAVAAMLVCDGAFADYVWDAKITKIYTSTQTSASTAHLIMLDQPVPSFCSDGRPYIELGDTQLYSTALAYMLAGKAVHLTIIQTGNKIVEGHTVSANCKVLNIFQ